MVSLESCVFCCYVSPELYPELDSCVQGCSLQLPCEDEFCWRATGQRLGQHLEATSSLSEIEDSVENVLLEPSLCSKCCLENWGVGAEESCNAGCRNEECGFENGSEEHIACLSGRTISLGFSFTVENNQVVCSTEPSYLIFKNSVNDGLTKGGWIFIYLLFCFIFLFLCCWGAFHYRLSRYEANKTAMPQLYRKEEPDLDDPQTHGALPRFTSNIYRNAFQMAFKPSVRIRQNQFHHASENSGEPQQESDDLQKLANQNRKRSYMISANLQSFLIRPQFLISRKKRKKPIRVGDAINTSLNLSKDHIYIKNSITTAGTGSKPFGNSFNASKSSNKKLKKSTRATVAQITSVNKVQQYDDERKAEEEVFMVAALNANEPLPMPKHL